MFEDREDAGKKLADKFNNYKGENIQIFALSQGGIVVACEVASKLNAPIDIIAAIKLRLRNVGIGAVAPGKTIVLNDKAIKDNNFSQIDIEEVKAEASARISQILDLYRNNQAMPDIENKVAIVIDDGAITGDTARAAIRYIKSFEPQKVIVGVPICPESTLTVLRAEADDVIFVETPKHVSKVAEYYEDFMPVNDESAIKLLKSHT